MRRVSCAHRRIPLLVGLAAGFASSCALLVDFEGYETATGSASSGSGGQGQGGGPASCLAPSDCPSFASDGPCQITSCTDGACAVALEPAGTPVGPQTAGDCQIVACDGKGKVLSAADPTDAFDDQEDCTVDACDGTTPTHAPAPEGTPCGNGLSCNASGECAGCTDDAQCPADEGCTDHGCNQATTICEQAPMPDGTPCPDALFCNGAETCQAGSCASPGDPCGAPDGDDDCSEACDEASDSCSLPDPDGSACTDGVFCNGADTCAGGACTVHGGNPCPGPDNDSDCSESCNEATDACDAPDPDGTSCEDGLYCTGMDTCMSGFCQHTALPCLETMPDSDCSDACDEATDTCTAESVGICKIGNDFGDCMAGTCVIWE